jgi:2,4-dienoyl-CoA reductase-like NADH-dependent reductase (Old Yellow Enzyme family)
VPTTEVAEYYRTRAVGGVGLIVSEAIAVDRPAAIEVPGIPVLHSEAARAAWKDVVSGVHQAGGRIAGQLHHAGAIRDPEAMGTPDVPNDEPDTMSDEDIADTIAAFGKAAKIVRELGFDAVEIHGANGNLIDQFLWAGKNHREDRWGGDPVSRTRFASEILRTVRQAVGEDFPISFRISQFKQRAFDARLADTPDQFAAILQPLVDAGVDLFHASQRRFWEPAFDGSGLNLAGWVKKLTGKPTITVGSVGLQGPDVTDLLQGNGGPAGPAGLDDLRARIEMGEFDLVAVGRALLTDPNWAAKVRDGRTDDLRGFDLHSLHSLVVADPAVAITA